MPKVFVGLLFVVALSAQVTTIPAAAGGGVWWIYGILPSLEIGN